MADLAKLQSLFEQACELPRAEQAAFVDAACADDAELHAELTALLASDEEVKDHTARKAVGDISALLNEGRPDALVGAQVGRYTLVSLIGAGGMGSVYLAERHDGVVQQRVAIKFLGRDLLGDGFRQRFEIEREILARLDHPNITRLIDAEQLPDGTPYYVMDYVEGQPITRYAFDNQLDINARLDLFVEVAKAVSHAHQALIVHRDIKPGNILVDTQGSPHLLDFGIAKPLAQLGAQTVSMTVTGQRFFSPQHAAPEQLLGGNITVGCDVYGLGCLLYELLSGEPAIPLTGLTAAEAEKQILHQLPQAPSQRVAQGEKNDERASGFGAGSVKAWSKSIKGELDSIVLTCLRKLPHERYRSVDDLIADVQAYCAGMPISASGGHGWYRTKKFVARHRWAVTAATLTAVALISSSVVTALQSREAKIQRDAAQTALAQAEQQRDRAQHVTQFLIDAFAAANPGGELGKSVTAREILEHGAKKLETELEGQPELKAQLLATIAEAQRSLGLLQEADITSSRAVDLAGTPREPTDVCFIARLAHARVLNTTNDPQRGENAIESLRDCARTDEQFADFYIEALTRRIRQGHARNTVKEAVNISEWLEGRSGIRATVKGLTLRRLVAFAYNLDSERQIVALREALSVVHDYEASSIHNPELYFNSYRTLAFVQRTIGQYSNAVSSARKAMDISLSVFGPESREYSLGAQSLQSALYEAGEYEESLDRCHEVLRINERILGVGAGGTMAFRHNCAISYEALEEFTKALELQKINLEIAREEYPMSSRPVFHYSRMVAQLLTAIGNDDDARVLELEAFKAYSCNPHSRSDKAFTDNPISEVMDSSCDNKENKIEHQ